MSIRRALWIAALAVVPALALGEAAAQQPKNPVKEARQEKKEAKEKLKEERKEAKEAKGDDKKDAKEDVKEAKKELRDARQKLREARKERREELRKAAATKWGDLVKKPKVRAELGLHARRMARLNQMEFLAKENDKEELLKRVEKLKVKENERHDKRMEALKAKGGEE